MPYRKVDRLLRLHGFAVVRQKGSHVIYRHPSGASTVVPRHPGDIDADLVAQILKEAGIDPEGVRR